MLTEAIPTENLQKAVNRNDVHEEKSLSIIKKYTIISAGTALVPYDFVDVISSTVAQTLMVKELCQVYQVSFSEKLMNVAFWSAAGSVITKAITEVIGTLISKSSFDTKFDLTGAAVAGIYTATLGEFYKLHLRDGGTLENIQISDFVDYFVDEIKRGDLSLATFTNPKTLMNHLNIA